MLDYDINVAHWILIYIVFINITNDPKCQCGAPYEDSIHYLMECPLYQHFLET
jgi:hypothetical protein